MMRFGARLFFVLMLVGVTTEKHITQDRIMCKLLTEDNTECEKRLHDLMERTKDTDQITKTEDFESEYASIMCKGQGCLLKLLRNDPLRRSHRNMRQLRDDKTFYSGW